MEVNENIKNELEQIIREFEELAVLQKSADELREKLQQRLKEIEKEHGVKAYVNEEGKKLEAVHRKGGTYIVRENLTNALIKHGLTVSEITDVLSMCLKEKKEAHYWVLKFPSPSE